MAIVDYSAAPPGLPGYVFHRDDGTSAHLYGPEADGLKTWLDQTRPPDARLASNAGAAEDVAWLEQHGRGYADTPPPAPQAVPDVQPRMAPPMPQPQPQPQVAPRPAAIPVQAPGAELPVVGNEPTPGALAQTKRDALEQLAISTALKGHYVPGRAAVDPHALAAAGVPVPVTETVQGGLPETPEERKAREEQDQIRAAQREEQIAAFKAATEDVKAGYEDQRSQALALQEKAQNDQRAELARRKAIEDEYAAVSAKAQKELDAATSAEVDPGRIFRGEKGTAAAVMSAISVGLGAFGSVLARSPNYAQQIVTAAIDRDIAAQQDHIARRGAAAQNTLAAIHRKYGLSLDESSSLLKEAQLRYAAATAQRTAARIGSAEAQQKAAAFTLDMLGKADKEAAERAELFKGRKTTQYAVVQPQKATAGYYTGPTNKDIESAVGSVAKLEKAIPGGGGAEEEGKIVPNLTRAATAVDTGLSALPELMKLHKEAGTTGQALNKAAKVASFGLAADTPLTTAAQHFAYSVASAEVNGMVPDKDRVDELVHLFSATNPTTREQNIKMGADILRKKKQAIESVSAKTAKIGTVSMGSGDEGGASE